MPRKIGPKGKAKMQATMGEFQKGTLHSGSKRGPKVTDPKQALAIGISQARKASRLPQVSRPASHRKSR